MIVRVLSWAWSALTGGGLLRSLAEAYVRGKDSAVESERVAAEVAKHRLDVVVEGQKLAQQVRLATAGFLEVRAMTFAIAAPFALHSGAVGLTTTFGLGWKIAAYPAPFNEYQGAILLSYFGLHAGLTGIRAIASAVAGRAR